MAREMKDSGIEWIGKIPEKWNRCRLKFHCSVLSGFPFDSKNFSLNQGVPLIRIRDITSGYTETRYAGTYNDEYLIKNGDILVGMDGDFNIRIWNGNEALLNQRCCKVTEDEHISHLFLFYCLPFRLQWVNDLTYSTTVKHLSTADITETVLFLPSLPDQHRIATFLDRKCAEIDSVIADTQKTIEEYKALKQSIITEAVTKGVRGERKMKDSGVEWIKEIPYEWESINPKALFSQRKDKAQYGQRQLTASQQYGVIYQDEYMRLTGVKVVTVEKDFDILKQVEAGDFVISMRSFQGGLEYSTLSGSISSAYVMLFPNLQMVYPKFYRWLFKSSVYINALQSTSNMVRDGQAMRYSNFAQVRLYALPFEEQEEISVYLDAKCAEIDRLIAAKQQLLTELESYKKSVIYEYVTGKKEVI